MDWDDLPDEMRLQLDGLIRADHKIRAVKVLRDSFPEPRPGLYECLDLIADRTAALGLRFAPGPTPPLDPDAIERKIRALPWPAAAIEAEWDGDTFGWMVRLLAVAAQPGVEHWLESIRHGNGQLTEATRVGRLVADRLGIPFHFASPQQPEIDQPRWWDTAKALRQSPQAAPPAEHDEQPPD